MITVPFVVLINRLQKKWKQVSRSFVLNIEQFECEFSFVRYELADNSVLEPITPKTSWLMSKCRDCSPRKSDSSRQSVFYASADVFGTTKPVRTHTFNWNEGQTYVSMQFWASAYQFGYFYACLVRFAVTRPHNILENVGLKVLK